MRETFESRLEDVLAALKAEPAVRDCVVQADEPGQESLAVGWAGRLRAGLLQHGGIRRFSLSGHNVAGAAASELCEFLRCGAELRSVDLSFCGLDDDAVEQAVSALACNAAASRVQLNASFNSVSPEVASRLATVLEAAAPGTALRQLELKYTRLDTAGVAALIRHSGGLELLDCSSTCVSAPVDAIAAALQTTRLRKLRLCGLDLTPADGEQLRAAAERGGCEVELEKVKARAESAEEQTLAQELQLLAASAHEAVSPRSPTPSLAAGAMVAASPHDLAGYSFNDERSSAGGSPPPVASSPLIAGATWRAQLQQHRHGVLVPGTPKMDALVPSTPNPHAAAPGTPNAQAGGQDTERGTPDEAVRSPPPPSDAAPTHPSRSPRAETAQTPELVSALVSALNMLRERHADAGARLAEVTRERDFLQSELRKEAERRRRAEAELRDARRHHRRRRSVSPNSRPSPSPRPVVHRNRVVISPQPPTRCAVRSRSAAGNRSGGSGGSAVGRTEERPQVREVLGALDTRLHSAPAIGLAMAACHDSVGDEYIPGVNGTPPLRDADDCGDDDFSGSPAAPRQKSTSPCDSAQPAPVVGVQVRRPPTRAPLSDVSVNVAPAKSPASKMQSRSAGYRSPRAGQVGLLTRTLPAGFSQPSAPPPRLYRKRRGTLS
eukprot:TRINITY_DN2200_c0_g1_i1.p1 TRINITY_DN2200_c0_g1~~TRINITY_DN2200_c0_g1_i1.p1  ORF type:complete len:665 (+),score=230.63 TRINITY_DN2200_c0_g1_i1:61-2055(+)